MPLELPGIEDGQWRQDEEPPRVRWSCRPWRDDSCCGPGCGSFSLVLVAPRLHVGGAGIGMDGGPRILSEERNGPKQKGSLTRLQSFGLGVMWCGVMLPKMVKFTRTQEVPRSRIRRPGDTMPTTQLQENADNE